MREWGGGEGEDTPFPTLEEVRGEGGESTRLSLHLRGWERERTRLSLHLRR